MDLNNVEKLRSIDPEKMIDHINGLPEQLAAAWQLGLSLKLPKWDGIEQVLVCGMGGSAIGADLVAAYVEGKSKLPVIVHRDYNLPKWANKANTLVVLSSHSGNTEEVLSVLKEALESECKLLGITTGGKLQNILEENKLPVWLFNHSFQPRTAVGYSFALLLALLKQLGAIDDPSTDLEEAVAVMKSQQVQLLPEVADTANPAKRMAGQLMGRWITIWGAGHLAPVARRWKGQINENAKVQAAFEALPEADHNAFQGIMQPEAQFGATMHIFLRYKAAHPRNELRTEFTRMGFMLEGQNTDFYKAKGSCLLAQMFCSIHFGDYVSYYLAIAYQVDPSPVPVLIDLKSKLNEVE